MNKRSIRSIPAVTQVRKTPTAEFGPGQMKKGLAPLVHTAAGDAGGVHVGNSTTIPHQAGAQARSPLELMMHVAENDEIGHPCAGDAIKCQSQILITPVHGWSFPVPTAGTCGIRAEAAGAAMGHEHKRLFLRNQRRGRHDPVGGLFQGDGSVNRFHRFREVISTPRTAGTSTNHRERQWIEIKPAPSAIDILDKRQLLAQHASTSIPTPVVVAQDQGQGEGQLTQASGEAEIPIAEITHKQNGVRLKPFQQLLIRCAPGAVQVPSDGEMKIGQSRCLGCRHPARS